MRRTLQRARAIENTPLGLLVPLLAILAPAAHAGIADSPLPVLVPGQTTLHLYSVPGVINRPTFGTYFSCTSTDTATIQVGVEVFDSNNQSQNDAAGTSVSLSPAHSVMFGTHPSFGALFDSSLATGTIYAYPGSARILATSKKLICTAFLADDSSDPPTSMVYLTIIKKTKQKGE